MIRGGLLLIGLGTALMLVAVLTVAVSPYVWPPLWLAALPFGAWALIYLTVGAAIEWNETSLG
jgi:hypothetical protein